MKNKYPHFRPPTQLNDSMKTVRTSAHTTFNCNYHIIWIPKYRRAILKDAKLKEILESILRGQSEQRGWKVLALEIQPDHIHLFLSIPPRTEVAYAVNILKGNSSIQLRRVFPNLKAMIRKSLWADGYYVSTAGFISQAQVKRYIETQNEKMQKHKYVLHQKAEVRARERTLGSFLNGASLPPQPKGRGFREAI